MNFLSRLGNGYAHCAKAFADLHPLIFIGLRSRNETR
jgi:hypothetical protein